MNFVFWLLVVIGMISFWFLMAFTFYPIGKFFGRIINDALEEMKREETNKEDKEKER